MRFQRGVKIETQPLQLADGAQQPQVDIQTRTQVDRLLTDPARNDETAADGSVLC